MKIELLMLDQPILVCDEEIKEDDKFYCLLNGHIPRIDSARSPSDAIGVFKSGAKKIIAGIPGLPSIDFSVLPEEDCKKIGWIDVEKLAYESCQAWEHFGTAQGGFIAGFKKAQSINEKKFTEDDIIKAMYSYASWITGGTPSLKIAKTAEERINQIIQSLSQPKTFHVEVEMKCVLGCDKLILNGENSICCGDKRPRIENDTIKITNIL